MLSALLGEGAPLFHWHLDTFTLPPGAVHLAASAMTENQAFRIGRAVYGIQFHFEADRALVERWNREFAELIAEETPDWPERHAARGRAPRRRGRRGRPGARPRLGRSSRTLKAAEASAFPARPARMRVRSRMSEGVVP